MTPMLLKAGPGFEREYSVIVCVCNHFFSVYKSRMIALPYSVFTWRELIVFYSSTLTNNGSTINFEEFSLLIIIIIIDG